MYALDYIAAWEHFVLIGSQANGIVMSVLWSLSFVRGLEKKLPPPTYENTLPVQNNGLQDWGLFSQQPLHL